MATGNDFNKPSGTSPVDQSLSGWEDDIVTSEEEQKRVAGFPGELKTCFGFRKVSTIPKSETEKKLKKYTGELPVHQEKKGLGMVRKVGRLFGRASKNVSVYPHKLQDNFPEVPPALGAETDPEKATAHIFIPDSQLAKNLLPGEDVYVRPGRDQLFAGEPNPADVRQTDRRSTCYLMSTLASYAASPVGKKVLKEMVRPAGDGHALVTFYDSSIGENIQVMVSTDRLVDKNGQDLYSFGNATDACWAGVIEKAYHAYKLSRAEGLREQIRLAQEQEDTTREGFLHAELQKIAPLDPKRSLMDWGDILHAISCMPKIPVAVELPSWGDDLKYSGQNTTMLHGLDLRDEGLEMLLRFNVEMGIPVILGTPPMKSFAGPLRALKTGTPTGHAVAVLGPAGILKGKKGGTVEEGVLIYDPYGITLEGGQEVTEDSAIMSFSRTTGFGKKTAVTGEPELADYEVVEDQVEETSFNLSDSPVTPMPSAIAVNEPDDFEYIESSDVGNLLTKASGRSVRFYPYSQLRNYFVKGAVAPGGYS